MVEFADLPAELVDGIFAFVEDASSLFPFLLSKRIHESARVAMHQNVTVREGKYKVFLKALLSSRRKFNDRATYPKALRIDCSGPSSPPAYYYEEFYLPTFEIELASSSVEGMLSMVKRLEILSAPARCRYIIEHPHLEKLFIRQKVLEEWEQDERYDIDNYRVTLEISGPSSLRSLSAQAGLLTISGTSVACTLTELCLLCPTRMVINGSTYALAYRRSGGVLPFTQLRKFTLFMVLEGTTLYWLRSLSSQLLASRQTLQGLYLCGSELDNLQCSLANPVDLSAYTSLQQLGVLARVDSPCATGSFHDGIYGTRPLYDGNRSRIISPTISSVILRVRRMAKSPNDILTCIDNFLQDNTTPDRLSSLQTIRLAIDDSFIGDLREEHDGVLMKTTMNHLDFYHKNVICRHGNFVRMPITPYIRIIATLKELTTIRAQEVAVLELRFGVRIDMSNVHDLLSRECKLKTRHAYRCHCEQISAMKEHDLKASRRRG